MSKKIAFPFLTLPDEAIKDKKWLIGEPNQPLKPIKDTLENWDYACNLEVSLDISIDMEIAAATLRVSKSDLELEAILRAGTGAGSYPRRSLTIARETLQEKSSATTLRSLIKSNQLSGRLRLDIDIVLKSIPTQRTRLSPAVIGARLWNDRKDILIEDGGQSRFPMEMISFSRSFPNKNHSHSPWLLLWKPTDWDMDFSSAVRLYINSDIPEFKQRIVESDRLTLQTILADTAVQLISGFLQDKSVSEDLSEFEEGTLGAQVRSWLENLFPDSSLEVIRSMLEHQPSIFHATVLSGMELGEYR